MAKYELKLLGGWFSPFALRVQISLNIKSLDYENIKETLNPKSTLLHQSNPVHKQIPVLLHGDKPICESRFIVKHIDDVWTNAPSILLANAYDRANARFLARRFSERQTSLLSLQKVFSKVLNSDRGYVAVNFRQIRPQL